jgi:hypothetical protein
MQTPIFNYCCIIYFIPCTHQFCLNHQPACSSDACALLIQNNVTFNKPLHRFGQIISYKSSTSAPSAMQLLFDFFVLDLFDCVRVS